MMQCATMAMHNAFFLDKNYEMHIIIISKMEHTIRLLVILKVIIAGYRKLLSDKMPHTVSLHADPLHTLASEFNWSLSCQCDSNGIVVTDFAGLL